MSAFGGKAGIGRHWRGSRVTGDIASALVAAQERFKITLNWFCNSLIPALAGYLGHRSIQSPLDGSRTCGAKATLARQTRTVAAILSTVAVPSYDRREQSRMDMIGGTRPPKVFLPLEWPTGRTDTPQLLRLASLKR